MTVFAEVASSHPTVLKLVAADSDPRGGRVTLGSEVIDGLHPWAIIRPFKDSGLSEGIHLYRKGLAFHDDGQPVATQAGFVWQVSNGGQARSLTVEDSQSVMGNSVSLTDPGLTYYEVFDAQDILDRGDGYFEAGEYGLDCQGDIELHYQPPLTAEQISEGASRPIEMEGGYAAYHSTKRNNSLCHDGSPKNTYQTGKVGNIFRPFADCYAAGNILLGRVWGKWELRSGSWFKLIPTAEIPQGTTRIEVDATIGYTTEGGSNIIIQNYNVLGNVTYETSTEAGTATSYSFCCPTWYNGYSIVGLYTGAGDGNGNETLKEDLGAGVAVSSTSGNWRTFNSVSSPTFVSSTGVFATIGVTGRPIRLAYDSVATDTYQCSYTSPLPNPSGCTSILAGTKFSKYVTYTPAATGHPAARRFGRSIIGVSGVRIY